MHALRVILLVWMLTGTAYGQYYGDFPDPLDGTFVEGSQRPEFKLRAPFRFIDPNGFEWLVPTDAVVNGASIPEMFWGIAAPFSGQYMWASVVHDYYCDTQSRTAHDTHRSFYYGMLAKGVDKTMADFMYWAVATFGPQWEINGPPSVNLSDPVAAAAAKSKAAAVYRTLTTSDGIMLDNGPFGEIPNTVESIESSAEYYRTQFISGAFVTQPSRMGILGFWSNDILGSRWLDARYLSPLQAPGPQELLLPNTDVLIDSQVPFFFPEWLSGSAAAEYYLRADSRWEDPSQLPAIR